VTRNISAKLFGFAIGMDGCLQHYMSTHWRTSLVPAPAVTPAPGMYAKVAVVKKFVVESLGA
jgi:hypothetical protein